MGFLSWMFWTILTVRGFFLGGVPMNWKLFLQSFPQPPYPRGRSMVAEKGGWSPQTVVWQCLLSLVFCFFLTFRRPLFIIKRLSLWKWRLAILHIGNRHHFLWTVERPRLSIGNNWIIDNTGLDWTGLDRTGRQFNCLLDCTHTYANDANGGEVVPGDFPEKLPEGHLWRGWTGSRG